jgi:hypothetical protein
MAGISASVVAWGLTKLDDPAITGEIDRHLALSVSAQMVRSKVRYSDAPPSIATSAPVM